MKTFEFYFTYHVCHMRLSICVVETTSLIDSHRDKQNNRFRISDLEAADF